METNSVKQVIVADDDASIRLLATRALSAEGFTVRNAADGLEAIKAMEAMPASILVTDIIMPNREGVETIIEVRRRWPATRIVAVSGGGRLAPEQFLDLAGEFGADATLPKPFSMSQLVKTVKSLAD